VEYEPNDKDRRNSAPYQPKKSSNALHGLVPRLFFEITNDGGLHGSLGGEITGGNSSTATILLPCGFNAMAVKCVVSTRT